MNVLTYRLDIPVVLYRIIGINKIQSDQPRGLVVRVSAY